MAEKLRDIKSKVEKESETRDDSYSALNEDERAELALFHSIKQDPYYKHYINHFRRHKAEEIDEQTWNLSMHEVKEDIYDHPRFDRLNLYDFRRNLPMKERQAKIDSKLRSYGYGKRKKARCLARVEPGKGTITVNGKPLL